MRRYGIGLRLLGAVAIFVVTFAASAVYARAATITPVGKPLALLAGLRPPQETKHATRHKAARHFAHVTNVHAKAAHEKTAERHRPRMASHARHASATRLAARHHAHHEQTVTASAFADEPSPQAASAAPPASARNWPVANVAPADAGVMPAATAAAAHADATGAYQNPDASKVQTIKITPANPAGLPDPAAASAASATAPTTDTAAAQTVLAASAQQAATNEPTGKTMAAIGSASWIAQVLAALGGAVAAGTLAWFLIGGGPVRTYG
ncbi:MAG: hypothetical protein WAU57_00865 [Xanthobacteraceae bacterium]